MAQFSFVYLVFLGNLNASSHQSRWKFLPLFENGCQESSL